jgi:hypothetical protein
VRAGRLRRLLSGFEPPVSAIHVVYPSRRHLSAKVRAFTDFLAERFATPEWALADEPAGKPPSASKQPAARRPG